MLPSAVYEHWLFEKLAESMGLSLDHPHWDRIVMYDICREWIRGLDPSRMSLLEISPADVDIWRRLGFRSSARVDYPEFDICSQVLSERFDLICADQVFEHLLWPYRAAKNIYEMLNPGGHALIATPFLLRTHPCPVDCSRWTETGMKYFLAECGFPLENIRTGSWGNRQCVISNLRTDDRWTRYAFWRSLKNNSLFPVTVWALAQKL
jgi:SAM-dependent methyltransferase